MDKAMKRGGPPDEEPEQLNGGDHDDDDDDFHEAFPVTHMTGSDGKILGTSLRLQRGQSPSGRIPDEHESLL
jgi:hypothetical protein